MEPLERGAHKQGQGQHDRSHGQPHIVYKLSALKQAREDDSSPCGVRGKERGIFLFFTLLKYLRRSQKHKS